MHLRYLNNIQKYHTDEVNKCYVSTINLIVMGIQICIFFKFIFPLVYYHHVLSSSVNKWQQGLKIMPVLEKDIFHES